MRRTTIALSTVALAASLSACGQAPETDSPEASGQSGQESSGAPYSDVASLVSGAGGSMNEKQSVTLDLKVDGGTGGAMPGMNNMSCQIDIKNTEMSCDGGPMEMVTTPEAMYMKNPDMAAMGGDPSKPWMKLSIDPNDPMGKMMAQQQQSLQKLTDFKEMLPPGTTITGNKAEAVNGKDATRYETVTDVAKAAEEADPELKPVYDMLTQSGAKEIKQSVWIDSEGLPVKAVSTSPSMNIQGQQTPEMTTTVLYKDWGKPVDITVPPQDKIQEFEMPSIPQPPN